MKKLLEDKTDWQRLATMTEEEIEANALSDPNNPLPPPNHKPVNVMARAQVIRRALRLTQEEFSERYQIPLGTLRDWEQHRSEPDQATRAYLKVIAVDPEGVAKSLREATTADRLPKAF
jgi:putative transcriptional regulator